MLERLSFAAWGVLALLAGAILGGCAQSGTPKEDSGSRYERLQSEDLRVRVAAIIEAGNAKDATAVPLLVNRLEDDDSDVRMFAILSLERITGHTFGYLYYQREPQRRPAVERWRVWLNAASQPATQTATGGH